MSKAWHWTGTARLEGGGIHHVGATAVPGLAAKPIMDVVAGVRDLEEARAAYAALSTGTSTRRTGPGSRTTSRSPRSGSRS